MLTAYKKKLLIENLHAVCKNKKLLKQTFVFCRLRVEK